MTNEFFRQTLAQIKYTSYYLGFRHFNISEFSNDNVRIIHLVYTTDIFTYLYVGRPRSNLVRYQEMVLGS